MIRRDMISETHLIDCMEFMRTLPDKFFDLAIVDPPYGIGLDMVNGIGSLKRNIHQEKQWNDAAPTEEYFVELHRVSVNQIIWGCNYYAKYIPAVGRIIHDKIMSSSGTAFKFSDADLASCSMQKRITMFRYEWSGNRQNGTLNWNNNGIDGRIHPTQKPVALYKWLLTNYAKPGQKIFDSHMGSQSSRIAAAQLGFDYWGCELDPDYYRDGCKRFDAVIHKKDTTEYVPVEQTGVGQARLF